MSSGCSLAIDFSFEKVIGSYRIVKKIGKGRFGLVKLGEHLTTGAQVAIKIVDKSGLNVVESNSIKTEAEVMTCLNHPNVVRLLEVIETKYELALIMEYANGGDLFEYVVGGAKRRKLSEKEVRSLFSQVVAGLAYCHRHFVVHRDIKAENILLDSQGNVRIGDWGFSSVYHPGLTIETACGSLDYAAPEVLTGLVSYGPSVDIWALGVLLYFLLSGRLPFTAPNDFDVYQLIKKAEYKTPKGISRECKNILKSLLNPDAQTRITISDVEKHPWMVADLDAPQPSSSYSTSTMSFTVPVPSHPNSSSQPSSHAHHAHHQKDAHSSGNHSHSSTNSSAKNRDSLNSNDSHGSASSGTSAASTGSSIASSNSNTSSGTSTSSAATTTLIKKKKRATKEKRSISDTKLEQSMHQLKAGSGQPTSRVARAGARRNATLRSEKSKLKDILGGATFTASSDPFNTITEEVDEEDVDDAAFSGSSSDEENELYSKHPNVAPLMLPISAFGSSSSIPSSPSSPLSAHSLSDARSGSSIVVSSPSSLPKASSTGRLDSTGGVSAIPGFIITANAASGSPRGKSPVVSNNSTPRAGTSITDTHLSGLSDIPRDHAFGSSESPSTSQVNSPHSNTQSPGRANQSETPGRSKRSSKDKKARSFNTEKTKEELAGVSRFIILKLSTSQLQQLRDTPEFEILQVTTKTTLKEDTLHTVVVATRVTNTRKYLKRFEQSRRLFRWNSDTHFGLRSRFRVENGTPGPTTPITPLRKGPLHGADHSPIPFSVSSLNPGAGYGASHQNGSGAPSSPNRASSSASSSTSDHAVSSPSAPRLRSASSSPQSPSQKSLDRSERHASHVTPSDSPLPYSALQTSSGSPSSSAESDVAPVAQKPQGTESPKSDDSASAPPQRSPPPARRRRKSITENRGEVQPGSSNASPSGRMNLTSSTPNASPGAPASPIGRPTLRKSNPPAKLARMHSWSQSEYDNAPPGTLKKQLAAGNTASPSIFKFFRKKRSDSPQDEENDTLQKRYSYESRGVASTSAANNGASSAGNHAHQAEGEDSVSHKSSTKAPSPIAVEELQQAPGSSPAKVSSPRSRPKHKKHHHEDASPSAE